MTFRCCRKAYGFAPSAVNERVTPSTVAVASVKETVPKFASGALSLPSISGLLQDGGLLSGTVGEWSGSEPISYAYQWELCNSLGASCKSISEAIGSTLKLSPADVGSIPADDVLADGLTVRQRLEAHRTNKSCINCHARIDPLGFALEPFDPLGRWRDSYRDGGRIDPSGTLLDGTTVSGPDGLRDYLRREAL